MDREAKLRRVEAVRRRLPHVSASALSSILAEVQQHGIPEAHGRRDLQQARDLVADADTPFGRVQRMYQMDGHGGKKEAIRLVHPIAYLWHLYNAAAPFADF